MAKKNRRSQPDAGADRPAADRAAAAAGRRGRPGRRSTPRPPRVSRAGRPTLRAATEALAPELGDLQERLFANGRVAERAATGGSWSSCRGWTPPARAA